MRSSSQNRNKSNWHPNSSCSFSIIFLHWLKIPLHPRFETPEYYGFGRMYCKKGFFFIRQQIQ